MEKDTQEKIKGLRSTIAYMFLKGGPDDYPDIIKISDEILEIGGEEDKIWAVEQKADVYLRMKDYNNALPYIDELIKLYEAGKKKTAWYGIRAEIYLHLKEYEKAISDATKATKYRSAFSIYATKAKALIELKKYDEAKQDLIFAFEELKKWHPSVQKIEGEEIKKLLAELEAKEKQEAEKNATN